MRRRPDPVVVRTRGGLLFAPDDEACAAIRCRPIVAEIARGRNRLGAAVTAVRDRGLGLRVALSTLRLGRLAERHAACAFKNALDDVSPTRLCSTHPDVRAMVASLVAQVGRMFAPDAIVLHDWDLGWMGEATAGLTIPVADRDLVCGLLAVCFCESCRQQAAERGLDVDAAVRSVRVTLHNVLESGPAGVRSFAEHLAADPVLRAYVADQSTRLTRATAHLAGTCGIPIILHRTGREHADSLEFVQRSVTGVCWQYSGVEFPDGCELEFRVEAETVSRPQGLVADVGAATARGVTAVTFAELGRLTPPAGEAVKQAIRYARRSAF